MRMGTLKRIAIATITSGMVGISLSVRCDETLAPSPENSAAQATDHFSASMVHVTPSGSYLFIGDETLFMPGIQLDESILGAILRAGGDTLFSKIVHHLLHMTMRSAYNNFTHEQFFYYMQMGIPLTYHAYYFYYQWPKYYTIAKQGWERTQTMVGWRRRGRMPVFAGETLDRSVFVDYLVKTQESFGDSPWLLEITPLSIPQSEDKFLSPWESSMAELLSTALNSQIDLIRIGVDDQKGVMTASWHNHTTGEWQSAELYANPDDGLFMSQWLENSWRDRDPAILYSSLDPTVLSCIESKLNGDTSLCQQPPSLITEDANNMIYRLQDNNSHEPTYIHLHNNPHWYVLGEPGYLSVNQFTVQNNQPSSHQYRMSRSMASVAEFIMNNTLRRLTDATLGSSVEKIIDWWNQKPYYQHVRYLQGQQVSSGIQQVRDKNGKIWIRKEAPLAGTRSQYSLQYAAMANEVLTLEQINHKNVITVKDHWLENAGNHHSTKMVTILEAGESDLLHHNFQDVPSIKQAYRDVLHGLQATHKAGFVHNDIKPDNFLRMADGSIKLIDFGAAAKIEADGKAPQMLRTKAYTSPLEEGGQTNDIWALGISNLQTLLQGNGPVSNTELIRGQSPYTGSFFLPTDSTDYARIRLNMGSNTTPEGHTLSNLMSSGTVLQAIPNYADFINKMLKMRPYERSTTEQLLAHPFLEETSP